MTDMIRIKVYVGTGFANANHEDIYEVEREWWESLTKEQQEKELDQMATDYLWNCIDCNAWVMEDDEE
jgi:hypothetical protein